MAACEGPAGQGGWRAADRQLCNDYLSYLADRRYSQASVRAYAFDLLHFVRWLVGQDIGLDGVDTETIVCLLIGGLPQIPEAARPQHRSPRACR